MPCNLETLKIEGDARQMRDSFQKQIAAMSQTQPAGSLQLAEIPAGSRMPKPYKKT